MHRRRDQGPTGRCRHAADRCQNSPPPAPPRRHVLAIDLDTQGSQAEQLAAALNESLRCGCAGGDQQVLLRIESHAGGSQDGKPRLVAIEFLPQPRADQPHAAALGHAARPPDQPVSQPSRHPRHVETRHAPRQASAGVLCPAERFRPGRSRVSATLVRRRDALVPSTANRRQQIAARRQWKRERRPAACGRPQSRFDQRVPNS